MSDTDVDILFNYGASGDGKKALMVISPLPGAGSAGNAGSNIGIYRQ